MKKLRKSKGSTSPRVITLPAYDQGPPPSSPLTSRVHGLSHKATVRSNETFTIEACDENGERRSEGGEAFFVAIRGVDRLRARIRDNEDGTYTCENPACVKLLTQDKFGNNCTRGGLRITGRLQLIKQGASDNKILMPNNHSVTIEDLHDGTYTVQIACMISATVKLIVNMDKDLPGTSGELAPMQLVFDDSIVAAAGAPAAGYAVVAAGPAAAKPAAPAVPAEAVDAPSEAPVIVMGPAAAVSPSPLV